MQNSMVMFTFFIFARIYSFWANFVPKFKIVCLNPNLVTRLQPWTKYLRKAVIFKEIANKRKVQLLFFHELFASIDKILVLGGRLKTRL